MDIRFKCENPTCDVEFEKTEEEIRLNPEGLRICWKCGHKLSIINTEEIVETDIDTQVKNNIDKWQKEIGWDNTIDLIKRSGNSAIARLYFEELRKRGFNIKGD
jgi:hypothetical protein